MSAKPNLKSLLDARNPYLGYTYAYPHKTAYRDLPPVDLQDVWKDQDRSQLFLYLHIPFCEMRCGFCNLFTTVNAPRPLEKAYLDTLELQARTTRERLGEAHFSRFAIGGGTPTHLEPADLERLFDIAALFGVAFEKVPTSVETSPATATPDRLQVLSGHQVNRVSIGIQSFLEQEVKSVGRTQDNSTVHQALSTIREAGIPVLNLDLIYGLSHQTPESWLQSLKKAMEYSPEEMFLYPLYVRPLTGIGRSGRSWEDERLELYRLGRDFLLSEGYEQVSMRFFRKSASGTAAPVYCCQEDGMVGLGCGARSYTSNLHYSSEYAVGQTGVKEILWDYVKRDTTSFQQVQYGIQLDLDTRKRRFILQSILHASGLSQHHYQKLFATDFAQDYPELLDLLNLGLATDQAGTWTLTPAGLEVSDVIGPWFYAPEIQDRMSDFILR
ncbi:STM4012 family radical SAM protein [Deinococcus roseus]|uniref:Coproporphyrinogen III oxidase n=1 Tax=Deinococcus roseus TaxID=392414 RepID=A0ABQ2CVC9_9DEIO|nr:STM4012 family radical SAM protein [Deinococcus roseus]GGJ24245.1 coproporphyrinogen III oxidase [Deinococcus roseus]